MIGVPTARRVGALQIRPLPGQSLVLLGWRFQGEGGDSGASLAHLPVDVLGVVEWQDLRRQRQS